MTKLILMKIDETFKIINMNDQLQGRKFFWNEAEKVGHGKVYNLTTDIITNMYWMLSTL